MEKLTATPTPLCLEPKLPLKFESPLPVSTPRLYRQPQHPAANPTSISELTLPALSKWKLKFIPWSASSLRGEYLYKQEEGSGHQRRRCQSSPRYDLDPIWWPVASEFPQKRGPLGKAGAELAMLAGDARYPFSPRGRVLPRELFHWSLKLTIAVLPCISADTHTHLLTSPN